MNSLMIMFYPHKFIERKDLRLKPKILEQETKVIRRVIRAHTELVEGTMSQSLGERGVPQHGHTPNLLRRRWIQVIRQGNEVNNGLTLIKTHLGSPQRVLSHVVEEITTKSQ